MKRVVSVMSISLGLILAVSNCGTDNGSVSADKSSAEQALRLSWQDIPQSPPSIFKVNPLDYRQFVNGPIDIVSLFDGIRLSANKPFLLTAKTESRFLAEGQSLPDSRVQWWAVRVDQGGNSEPVLLGVGNQIKTMLGEEGEYELAVLGYDKVWNVPYYKVIRFGIEIGVPGH